MNLFQRFALFFILGLSSQLDARIYTDVSGRTMDAELLSIFKQEVTFRRTGETRTFTLPLSHFAEKDRRFILNEKKAGRLSITGYEGIAASKIATVQKSQAHWKAAAKIDQLLEQHRAQGGFDTAPRTDDSTFLRRAYLTVIGRIPTYAEAVHFLNNPSPNKRVALIDQLLDAPGYVSHNFNLWADVLRAKTTGREGSIYGGVYFIPWLKEQIRQNVPYDQFVRSLITSEGYPWEDPATYYYLRDFGMPLDNMSLTSQVFLGTQMQCAQCHDHPTDVWTQKDFYELSAFTYGQKTGIDLMRENDSIQNISAQLRAKLTGSSSSAKERRDTLEFSREFFRPLRWGVIHSERKLHLPHDYQYEDALPSEVVEPKVLFGEAPHPDLSEAGPAKIDVYADWMTSSENARFSKVIANRMWKHVMGRGLIEPVDQLTAESRPLSPELMDYLESLIKSLDYDLKQYQRVLLLTAQFQRQSVIDDPDLPDDYHLQGPVFKRMTAEQIWDSLATLMTPEIDRIQAPAYKSGYQLVEYKEGKPPAIAQLMENLSGSDMVRYINAIQPAYQEFNEARSAVSKLRSSANTGPSDEMRQAQKRMRDAKKAWNQTINGSDAALSQMAGMSMQMNMSGDAMTAQSETTPNGYQPEEKWLRGIRRASELSSPANRGHLLEVFGQSDRDLVENADNDGNITQALFLMNSPQTNWLFSQRSTPVLEARQATTAEKKLETLYIGFLARKPTEQEKSALLPALEKEPEKARERIIWAMLNTRQFVFIQ